MASSRIKGITIEIGGDTTKLDKALRGTDDQIRDIQSDLRAVERALKLDPSNVDLLVQKQRLLGEAVSASKQRMDQLATAAKDAQKALAEGKIDENQYKRLNLELDLAAAAYKEAEKAANGFNDTASEISEVGNTVNDAGEKIKSGVAKIANAAVGVGKMTAAAATAAAGGLLALEANTRDYRVAQGKLNTAFEAAGLSAETAEKSYKGFYNILGDTDTATEASQLLATLVDSEKDVSTWTDIAAGVFGTFGDSLPINGLIEAANETAKTGKVTGVLADALNWAGISEDKFNERLKNATSESQRNRIIMDTLSITYDEAADAFYRNNEELIRSREVQASLDEALASLGETVASVKNDIISDFLPSITDVVSAFNDLVTGVDGADEAFSEAIQDMVSVLVEKLPEFLSFGVDILQSILSGILENLPILVDGLLVVVGAIGDAIADLAPMLWDAGIELLNNLADGLEQGIPVLLNKLPETIESILGFFEEHGPELMEVGGRILNTLVEGLVGFIPLLIEALPKITTALFNFFAENAPAIFAAGAEIINALILGILDTIPVVLENLPALIESVVAFITENAPEIIKAGASIITNLILGLIGAIPDLILALPDIIIALAEGFNELAKMGIDIGLAFIKGIWEGFKSATDWIASQIQGWIDGIIDMFRSLIEGIVDLFKGIFGGDDSSDRTSSAKPRNSNTPRRAVPMAVAAVEEESDSITTYGSRMASAVTSLRQSLPNVEGLSNEYAAMARQIGSGIRSPYAYASMLAGIPQRLNSVDMEAESTSRNRYNSMAEGGNAGRSAPMYANVTLVLNGTVLGRAVAPLVDNYNRLRGVDLVVN